MKVERVGTVTHSQQEGLKFLIQKMLKRYVQAMMRNYCKNPKILDTQKFIVITLKVEQDGVFLRVMHPKDSEGIANSVDPDQTAPLGAV